MAIEYHALEFDSFDCSGNSEIIAGADFDQKLLKGGRFRAKLDRLILPTSRLDRGSYSLWTDCCKVCPAVLVEGDTGKGKTEPSSCATAMDTMETPQSKAMVAAAIFMIDTLRGCGIGFQPV